MKEPSIERLQEMAMGGDVDAQIELGHIYWDGKGIRKSTKKARSWFERAARQGHALSYYHIAVIILSRIKEGDTSDPAWQEYVSKLQCGVELE